MVALRRLSMEADEDAANSGKRYCRFSVMSDVAGFPAVDALLEPFAGALGQDFEGYRNHVTRVLHFQFAISPQLRDAPEQVLVAAAFHDLGIWTGNTFDYIRPSRRLAREYLSVRGLAHHAAEVEAIIERHHKLRPYRGPFTRSVESFRQADLVDVSLGLVCSGIERRYIAAVRSAFPNAGFHKRLLALTARQFLRTPLRPLPMVQW